jgi:hypothetical protein
VRALVKEVRLKWILARRTFLANSRPIPKTHDLWRCSRGRLVIAVGSISFVKNGEALLLDLKADNTSHNQGALPALGPSAGAPFEPSLRTPIWSNCAT